MNKGYPSNRKRGNQEYGTLQPLGQGKFGADSSAMKLMYELDGVTYIPEATSTVERVDLAGHLARVGDIIAFNAGVLIGYEVTVISTTTNTISIANPQDVAITAAETFVITRPKNLGGNANGGLLTTSGPILFTLDGVDQEVTEDTVTPANNFPLPVKLTGVTGDVLITAGDLNVQLTHLGVNADVTRIGDGTTEWKIKATGEGEVRDLDVYNALVAINAKFGSLGQKLSGGSTPFVLSTEQEAILASIVTNTNDSGTETTLAALLVELQLKADLTETQPISAVALPLPNGSSTSANQVLEISNTGSIASTNSQLNAKFSSLGQNSSALSTPMVLSTTQELILSDIKTAVQAVTPKDVIDIVSPIDASITNIPASSGSPLEIVANLSAGMVKIQTIEDIGEFIGLYQGGIAAEILVCILPIAGGVVEVSVPSTQRLSIRNMKNTAIATGFFSANIIG